MKERNKRDRKERFLEKVIKIPETGCWEWTGPRFKPPKLPYGLFYWGIVDGKEKMITAHRSSVLLHHASVVLLPGSQICHKCNNPPCVNPDHLYVGDMASNMRDRDETGRTSKWDKRYNFKRSDELIAKLKECFNSGLTAAQTMKILGIGWQTIYRAREQSPELKAIMAETKRARYSKAGKQRWADGHGKGSKSQK
jgi:hypothetical protein